MFEVSELTVSYGSIVAVSDVSVKIAPNQVVCILGANGAGKSSLLKSIVGLVRPASGRVTWEGEDVTGRPSHYMTRCGITLSPEGRRLFSDLTVRENLLMGGFLRRRDGAFKADLDRVFTYFPRLSERANQAAGSLSGGEQQMCAIGRALMSGPRLLLLDEPSLGLSPIATAEVARIVTEIAASGMMILLVEQNARLALKLSRYAYVLETGRLALEGPAADMLNNAWVKEIYLGGAPSGSARPSRRSAGNQ
jgi:ABC-type branched-subunit amino acid transport system ATPase component